MKRLGTLLLIALAAPILYAQGWPMPAKTPDTPVTAANGHPKTVGYSLPLTTFTGRYLDSTGTRDYQMYFRTARANEVRIVPERNRIYMMIGSALFAYNLDTFFSRVATVPMMSAADAPVTPSNTTRLSTPETFLRPDSFFYAENGGGWNAPFSDGQDRLFGFDWDDRGYIYLATKEFGWGIVKDNLGTNFTRFSNVSQKFPALNDVVAQRVLSLKTSDGSYYAMVSALNGTRAQVFNVNDAANPVAQPDGPAFVGFAKAASGSRVAVIPGGSTLLIYTSDALARHGAPVTTLSAGDGSAYASVDSDGTNFYAALYSSKTGLTLSVITPDGGSYSEQRYRIGTQMTTTPVVRFGANFLTITGFESSGSLTWNARLFALPNGVPTEVSLSSYIGQYYSLLSPPGYDHPTTSYINMNSALVYRQNNKYYLFIAAKGLGDVYELRGADTLDASVKRVGDRVNPFSTAASGSGPYYGDNIVFSSSTSSSSPFSINWTFGDSTSNVTSTLTPDISHQYGGLSIAELPKTFQATATNTSDTSMSDTIDVVVKRPTVRIGLKDTSLLFTQPDASSPAAIVSGDAFTDASDGAVESHFNDWAIDAASPVRLQPSSPMAVGECGAHSLSFTAHYGPYDQGTLASSFADAPLTIAGFNYTVRPFAAAIAAPTSDATNVTFSSATRTKLTGSVNYKWELLNGTTVLSSANGTSLASAIPAFVVSKTLFQTQGLKVRLTATFADPSQLSTACAPYAESVAASGPLGPPNATGITVTGCANVSSPCSFAVTPAPQSDWTYAWSVTGPTNVAGGTAATFSPQITTPGTYTVKVRVSNAIGFADLTAPPQTLAAPICGGTPTTLNTAITYLGASSGCYTSSSACAPQENVTFRISTFGWIPMDGCATYLWDFGDGSPTSALPQPIHKFANGTRTVKLKLTIDGRSADLTSTIVIGNNNVPPPNPPPNNPPPNPPPSGGCGTLNNSSLYVGFYGGSSNCSGANTASSCSSGEQVSFNLYSNGTYSMDCGVHTFNWNFGDNGASSSATTQTPSHVYSATGTYPVTVVVHNPLGGQATFNATVKVNGGGTTPPPNPPPNPPPTPGSCNLTSSSYYVGYFGSNSSCTAAAGSCAPNENITFTALPTIPGGTCNSATYSWNFGDSSAPMNGQQGTHKFGTDGKYNVVLSITNGSTTVTVPQQVVVGSGTGITTKIDFSFAPWPGVPNGYEFTAISTPPGKATHWHFDFGDGNSSSNATAHNVYADSNDYTVTLTSSDAPGVTATHKIHDTPPPPPVPPRRRASRH